VEQQGWIVDGTLMKIEHDVVQFLQSHRLAYFGHVARMGIDRYPYLLA